MDLVLFKILQVMERVNRRRSSLGDREFFEIDWFPWAADVARATPDIQAELQALWSQRDQLPNFQDISPDQRALTNDDRWKTFFFYGYGVRASRNCRVCPKTADALRRIPGLTTAFFSFLAPGKTLPPHRGPYNGVLRYHLGLVVPQGPEERCAIRVGSTTRVWREGEGMVFDDTYDHEVWNHTSEWRVVLFIDFKRPLPGWSSVLNTMMLLVIRYTPFVTMATRNHCRWEKVFYAV